MHGMSIYYPQNRHFLNFLKAQLSIASFFKLKLVSKEVAELCETIFEFRRETIAENLMQTRNSFHKKHLSHKLLMRWNCLTDSLNVELVLGDLQLNFKYDSPEILVIKQ